MLKIAKMLKYLPTIRIHQRGIAKPHITTSKIYNRYQIFQFTSKISSFSGLNEDSIKSLKCREERIYVSNIVQIIEFYNSQPSHKTEDLLFIANNILGLNISEDEKSAYSTKIDEIGFELWAKLPQINSGEDLVTVYRFGAVFKIEDQGFWEEILELIENCADDLEFRDLATLVYIMEEHEGEERVDIIRKFIRISRNKISIMTCEELAFFTLYYTKYGRMEDQDFLSELDSMLSRSVDIFSENEILIIMKALAVLNINNPLPMEQGIFNNFLQVCSELFIKHKWKLSKSIILYTLSAYSQFMPQNTPLFDYLENSLGLGSKELIDVEFTPNFILDEIITILDSYASAQQGSYKLYEQIHQIIGKNIKNIESSLIIPVLRSFTNIKEKDKIFILFHTKIKDSVKNNQLSVKEMCEIVALYTIATTHYDYIYQLLERYIINAGYNSELTPQDIVHSIYGYSNPNLAAFYHILDDFEPLLKSCLIDLGLDELLAVLSAYTRMQKGSKELIKELQEAIQSTFSATANTIYINPHNLKDILELWIKLDLSDKDVIQIGEMLASDLEQLELQDLRDCHSIAQERSECLDFLLNAISREINRFDPISSRREK